LNNIRSRLPVASNQGVDSGEGSEKRSRFYKPAKGTHVRYKGRHISEASLHSSGLSTIEIKAIRSLISHEVKCQVKLKKRTTKSKFMSFLVIRGANPAALSNGAIVSLGVGVAAASAAPALPALFFGAAILGGALGYGLTNEIPEE
jgi:hypothetical protein